MEIINLHKRCKKKKAAATARAKAVPKAPKSGYHLFLREKLDNMTGKDRKNYQSIVSKRWKKIKKGLARLSSYNDRARQMKNEAEKPGDDSQNEKVVADRPAVRLPQKAPGFVNTGLDDSGNEREPAVKHP